MAERRLRPAPAGPDHGPRAPGQPAAAPTHWRSEQLFGPLDEVQIAHGPFVYRLRKTSLGKLILTK